MKNNNILYLIMFVLLISTTFASTWSPSGDANFRGIYKLYNATNVTAGYFYGDGSGLTNIIAGTPNLTAAGSKWIYTDINTISWNETLGNSTYVAGTEANLNVNSSVYWNSYQYASDLNYKVLSYWNNITDKPTNLSEFTDDLGDRGYTSLSNFTNDKDFINSTYANSTYILQSEESNLNTNSSVFWGAYNLVSQLNYKILSYWNNITGRPTHLTNFTNDLTSMNNNINFNAYNLTNASCITLTNGQPMCWNSDEMTLDLPSGLGNTIQVGSELTSIAKNGQGSSIFNGQVVSLVGSSGDRGIVALADASNISIASRLGVVTIDECNNNADCPITTFGRVRDLNTSAWVAGTLLYLSADGSGNLTSTVPAFPNFRVLIAAVIRQHANDGIIIISPGIDYTDGVTLVDLYIRNNATIAGSLSVSGLTTALEFSGAQNWTDNQNYPSACPAGYAITQLGDSTVCTQFLQSYNDTLQSVVDRGDTADIINITNHLYTNDLTVSGDANINGLAVTGDGSISTELTVDNKLNVTGDTYTNDLYVAGDANINGLAVTGNGSISSKLTIDNTLNVTGTTYTSDIYVSGDAYINGLNVTTDGVIQGNQVINGNLTVLGTYVNASVETQYLNGSFIPSITSVFDLGSTSKKWDSLFVNNIQDYVYFSGTSVGIGASPTRNLDIVSATNSIVNIKGGNTSVSRLEFGDTDDIDVGMINYIHATNDMGFIVNAGTRMTIDSSGNVGIGTASPSALLDVGGATSSGLVAGSNVIGVNGAVARLVLSGSTQADTIFYDTAGESTYEATQIINEGGNTKFRILDDAAWSVSQDNVLVLDHSTANVGIGTASPAEGLHVLDAVTVTGAQRYNAIFDEDNTPATGRGGGIAFAQGGSILGGIYSYEAGASDDNAELRFQTRASDTVATRMTIISGGNVGIGTTTPGGKLHVEVSDTGKSNDVNSEIILESTGAVWQEFLADTDETSAQGLLWSDDDSAVGRLTYIHNTDKMSMYAGSTEQITLDGVNDRVGIGVNAPATDLEIEDASGATLRLSDTATVNTYLEIFSGNSGVAGSHINTGAAFNSLSLGTAGTNYLHLSGGEIGIGATVTNPSTNLQIASSGANGIDISQDLSTSGNSGRLFFSNGTAGDSFAIVKIGNILQFGHSATPGGGSGSATMVIQDDSDVGIGITNPSYRLDIDTDSNKHGLRVSAGSSSSEYSFAVDNHDKSSNYFYVRGDGRVSVGTSTPVGKFHVDNTEAIRGIYISSSAATDDSLRIYHAGGVNNGIHLDYRGTSDASKVEINGPATTGMLFDINDNVTAIKVDSESTTQPAIVLDMLSDIEVIDFDACSDGGTSHTTIAGSLKVQMPDGTTGYINFYS